MPVRGAHRRIGAGAGAGADACRGCLRVAGCFARKRDVKRVGWYGGMTLGLEEGCWCGARCFLRDDCEKL